MFSKDSKSSSTSTSASTNGSSESHSNGVTGVPSIISPDLTIIGDLKSGGDIQVDGSIEGDINSRLLTVGERAKVQGSIVADTIRISGTVIGQIKAKSVFLEKSARVTGDITHGNLTMEAGALLEGHVRRMENATQATNGSAKVEPLRPVQSSGSQGSAYSESQPSIV